MPALSRNDDETTMRRPYQPDASLIRYSLKLFAFTDLVADDATDRGAADRSDCAAARQNIAADCTDAGADCGVPVSRRHPATSTQTKQQCHGHRTDCKSFHRFHSNTSRSNFGLSIYICLSISITYQQSICTGKSTA
jgi:hypothetical protein